MYQVPKGRTKRKSKSIIHMKKISFTIRGNQEDPEGNPIPYTRVLKHSWRDDASRYMEWCEYVRAEFARACEVELPIELEKNAKAQIGLKVFWKSSSHGDLDNILKGILDALFKNDKCINGIVASSEMAPDGKGRLEIQLALPL